MHVRWWFPLAEQDTCYGQSCVQFAVATAQVAPYAWLISAKAICPTETIPHVLSRLVIASICSCLLEWPGSKSLLPRWEGSKPPTWGLALMPEWLIWQGVLLELASFPIFPGADCPLPALSALRCTRKRSGLLLDLEGSWLSMVQSLHEATETSVFVTSLDYLFNWKKKKKKVFFFFSPPNTIIVITIINIR